MTMWTNQYEAVTNLLFFVCLFCFTRISQVRKLISCPPQRWIWESVPLHILRVRAGAPAAGWHKEKVNWNSAYITIITNLIQV